MINGAYNGFDLFFLSEVVRKSYYVPITYVVLKLSIIQIVIFDFFSVSIGCLRVYLWFDNFSS